MRADEASRCFLVGCGKSPPRTRRGGRDIKRNCEATLIGADGVVVQEFDSRCSWFNLRLRNFGFPMRESCSSRFPILSIRPVVLDVSGVRRAPTPTTLRRKTDRYAQGSDDAFGDPRRDGYDRRRLPLSSPCPALIRRNLRYCSPS